MLVIFYYYQNYPFRLNCQIYYLPILFCFSPKVPNVPTYFASAILADGPFGMCDSYIFPKLGIYTITIFYSLPCKTHLFCLLLLLLCSVNCLLILSGSRIAPFLILSLTLLNLSRNPGGSGI